MPRGVLDGLAPDDERALHRLGTVRRHQRGTYLLLEGDRSDHVLLLRAGRIKIVRTSDDGRESLIAIREAGDLVGELNVLAGSDEPRTASAVALDDVMVQSIAAKDFLAFVAAHSAVSFSLMRQLARRLRESTGRHADAAGYDSLHRVARVLVEHAERFGKPVDGGVVAGAGLTQHELAGLVATSPTSVARALSALRARGLVTTARRQIVIRDLEGLRRFSR
jgi:CRP/FNR family transcriptional regulator, cyclic AMP receptor protein